MHDIRIFMDLNLRTHEFTRTTQNPPQNPCGHVLPCHASGNPSGPVRGIRVSLFAGTGRISTLSREGTGVADVAEEEERSNVRSNVLASLLKPTSAFINFRDRRKWKSSWKIITERQQFYNGCVGFCRAMSATFQMAKFPHAKRRRCATGYALWILSSG